LLIAIDYLLIPCCIGVAFSENKDLSVSIDTIGL
jgi:hypothetical protein